MKIALLSILGCFIFYGIGTGNTDPSKISCTQACIKKFQCNQEFVDFCRENCYERKNKWIVGIVRRQSSADEKTRIIKDNVETCTKKLDKENSDRLAEKQKKDTEKLSKVITSAQEYIRFCNMHISTLDILKTYFYHSNQKSSLDVMLELRQQIPGAIQDFQNIAKKYQDSLALAETQSGIKVVSGIESDVNSATVEFYKIEKKYKRLFTYYDKNAERIDRIIDTPSR